MTKIGANYDNRTTEAYGSTAKAEDAAETGKKNSKTESSNIYGGNLMLGQDEIGRRQAMAGKDALKKIMDVFSSESKVDKELERRQENIAKQQEEVKSREKQIEDLDNQAADYLKNNFEVDSVDALTPEQRKGYDEYMKDVGDRRKELNKLVGGAKYEIYVDQHFIKAVHKERLKNHNMVDAQKEAAEIMKDASREAVNMMVDDAVKQQEEDLEEIKEQAEAQQEPGEAGSGAISQSTQKDIINAEADKMVAEKKMTREDVKGIACDELI